MGYWTTPAKTGEATMAVRVTAQRLWQFGTYLNSEVWADFHQTLRDQAQQEGCNAEASPA